MSDQSFRVLPVLLSGGAGTRLWPLSRESHPKQLIGLIGADSLLQQTVGRLSALVGKCVFAPPCVVCNTEYRFLTAEQLRAAGCDEASIILEPCARNTAPALTLAALHARRSGDDPVLLVMPADHIVADPDAFAGAVAQGMAGALDEAIVTFGIVPTRAETAYGYLRRGAATGEALFELESFREKPDAATAAEYLHSGDYLWNSGMFLMRAEVWLRAMRQFNPEMFAACSVAYETAEIDADFVRVDSAAFAACPSDSIDYAVMERIVAASEGGLTARVVPLDAGWSDIGAWDAVWDVLDKDGGGNACRGDVLTEDCRASLFFSSGRLLAGVGLDNVVVVETPDAVLVADKRRAQDVKRIVSRLKAEGYGVAAAHRKVYRPWGWYDAIDGGERFQVKRIVVNPGASLSLQMHHHRAEHWVVVRGTAEVTNGENVMLLSENESTYIPLGHVHRLANPGRVPLEIIEVQSGSYLGEDDIVRFEDVYGRTPSAEGARS